MSKRKKALDFSIVYIIEEKCFGTIVSLGAHVSRINYRKDGIEYTVDFLNEEFEIVEESGINYIEEDL